MYPRIFNRRLARLRDFLRVSLTGAILGEGDAEVANILEFSNGQVVQLEMGAWESGPESD
jgi:hypothetical protein